MTDQQRSRRRSVQGTVSSDKMDKTITVSVERLFKHPKYKKYIRKHSKVQAHDERNEAGVGFAELSSDLFERRSLGAESMLGDSSKTETGAGVAFGSGPEGAPDHGSGTVPSIAVRKSATP